MSLAKYWGVALLLHPFILRVTSFRLRLMGGESEKSILVWINRKMSHAELLQPHKIGQETFFIFATVLSLIIFGMKSTMPIFERIILTTFVVLSWFNVYDFLSPSVYGQVITTLIGVLFIFQIYEIKEKEFILKCMGYSSMLVSIFVILESIGFNPFHTWFNTLYDGKIITSEQIVGPLNNPNHSGAYIALTIPALLYFRNYYGILLGGCAIYLLGSLMPVFTVLGFFICLGYSLYIDNKSIPYIAAGVALIASYFYFGAKDFTGPDSGRFLVWTNAFDFSFFGKGLGWFADVFGEKNLFDSSKFRSTHNELLDLLISHGIVGVSMIIVLFKRSLNKPFFQACLFAVFINCLGNFTMHMSALFVICAFYYVFGLREGKYV